MKAAYLTACALLLGTSLSAQDSAAAPRPQPPKRTVEFTGLVLLNGFYNSARVNNSDAPQVALADTNIVNGGGGTVRQTRLRVIATDGDVLGGTGGAEVDVDFFGGQPGAGGRTFPLLRLRRAIATVSWGSTELLLGQEAPLVASRDPRTLASIGFPDFASAGNLWLWIPQARLSWEKGYTLRLGIQAALMAPTANGNSGAFLTQPDSAERSGRPFAQGRVRLGWGKPDDPSEIAVGGHIGWIRSYDATTGDSLIQSSAITGDARFSLGEIEVLGEFFMGQALGVLGGGGVGQTVGLNGVPVRTRGGWGQLNLRLRRNVTVGGGCGLDDPDDTDLLASGALRNFVCAGMLDIRSGPLAVGFELRRLQTEYLSGEFIATHINVAAGWTF